MLGEFKEQAHVLLRSMIHSGLYARLPVEIRFVKRTISLFSVYIRIIRGEVFPNNRLPCPASILFPRTLRARLIPDGQPTTLAARPPTVIVTQDAAAASPCAGPRDFCRIARGNTWATSGIQSVEAARGRPSAFSGKLAVWDAFKDLATSEIPVKHCRPRGLRLRFVRRATPAGGRQVEVK